MDEKTISTAELISALNGADENARWDAVEKAPGAGAGAIGPLAEVMGGSDPAAAKAASEAIRKIVYSSGATAPPELVKLIDPGHPRQVRADALRYLGQTGGRREVKAVAALLSESDIREDARMALEQIPDAAAEEALKKARDTALPTQRAGLRQSLRHRQLKMRDAGIRRG